MAVDSKRLEIVLALIDKANIPLRGIQKQSAKAAKDLKATRDRLKELDQQQRSLKGFDIQQQKIVATSIALGEARQQAKAVGAQYANTELRTAKLTRAYDKARETVQRLEQKQRAEVHTLADLRTKLESAGLSTDEFTRSQSRVSNEIEETNRALDAQKRKIVELGEKQRRQKAGRAFQGRMNSAAGNLAISGAAAGATAGAMAAPILGAKNAADEYESRLTDIAQKADLARSKAGSMGDQLRKTAIDTNQLPPALLDAADTLAGMGMDPQLAVKLTKPLGRAATAYKADMNDLAAAAFTATDTLGISADKIGKVLDVMAYGSKKGAVEVKDMAAAMPGLAASYSSMGQKGVGALASLTAAMEVVRKGAPNAEEATTNLENLLQKMNAPQTARNFAKMGIDLSAAMKQAVKDGKDPIEAITDLTDKALKGDWSRLGYLFEDAQVQKALRPLHEHIELLRELRAGGMAANGVVDKDYAERMQDNAEKTKKLMIQMNDLKLTIGGQLQPVLAPLIEKVTETAANFGAWTKENPKVAGAIGKVILVIGGLLAAVAAIALVLAPVLAFLALLGGAAVALGATAGVVAAWCAVVVGGIILVIDFVARILKGFTTLKDWWSKMDWALLGRNMISGLINGLLLGLPNLLKTVGGIADRVTARYKEKQQIHSPSRVFAQLGRHTMAGLDQGIEAGGRKSLARIAGVAAGMVGAAAVGTMPAAAAVAPGAPGGQPGATYYITIHAAAGADPKGIADAVRKVMAEAGAKAGSAAFADQD